MSQSHHRTAVIRLLEEGATIPFIARYRKEQTGGMDEVEIGRIRDEHVQLQELNKRKETILSTIGELGALTPELKQRIEECTDKSVLEDLYLPFKPKKKTKATVAREKGLEPLAGALMKQELNDPESYAQRFVKGEVPDVEEALEGAMHIMAEWISERAYARNKLRGMFMRNGTIYSAVAKGKEDAVKFADYFDYSSPIRRTPGHRLLAMLRGEAEGVLKVHVEPERNEALDMLNGIFVKQRNASGSWVEKAVKDAYMRLLRGPMETETRQHYRSLAEDDAIVVFEQNLEQLLMAPPVGQKATLAIDPGFRTGCKVVCLDELGNLRVNATIFPHPPQKQKKEAAAKISQFVEAYKIDVIAVGDGTAGRETLDWVRQDVYKKRPVEVYSVNEDGASIYSASAVAREEFPNYDVTVRGAVSIGRRLMDPMGELVKIDPKSIGVGQYQHDVDQRKLQDRLRATVERVVNRVGVDLNLASEYLLRYISGITPSVAANIVDHRNSGGAFQSREELLQVKGLGPKAFEQCAGFLRISGGAEPLDNSSIHPERYALVKRMAKDAGISSEALLPGSWMDGVELSSYLGDGVGLPTLQDIAREIQKPGRDPRGKARSFRFAEGIRQMSDLRIGMKLPGKVSNITRFGAFVDIGVKQDGLVHVSKLANRFVSDPLEVVRLGQEVEVTVLEVDESRNRINLSMVEA
ncbi:MAG: RNA-binding transcriptional accessory protein [Flavobacteriales bacterium]|nr:RNA-binding transcriptional accessory protein [Flavobacteriales bacterium]